MAGKTQDPSAGVATPAPRALGALLLALALALAGAAAAEVATPVPDGHPGVAAAYAVAVDGDLLQGGALDLRRQPASLSKLLAALVLLESGWDPEAQVTVSAAAAAVEGSRIGLRRGERLRAGDLLTGMLVRSGNDACLALVEHAAGTRTAFAARMNRRAAALGMGGSHFVHPCGLDAPGQHTTARDLLRLAEAARAEPQIKRRAGMTSATIRTEAGRKLDFDNSNALIGRAPEATGLKSGYTSGAGRCVIALAERSGHYALVVLLGATSDRWWDATGMLAEALGPVAPPRD
ncbi:MAG: serine hydrolase [Acidobacteriota bacterium]|jgi:D-alanyl-D-alanine carboxypeptidase (penicillin-binding protein 5/6)|nr:serine hydrolase [Acidobacteriota bacterium]